MDPFKVLVQGVMLLIHDFFTLVISMLIMVILGLATLGILAGPLSVGLLRMILLYLREGRPLSISDLFYFKNFGRYVAAWYSIELLIGIGLFAAIVPGLYLAAIWLYVLVMMVDLDLDFGEAMVRSKAQVMKSGLAPHIALVGLIMAGMFQQIVVDFVKGLAV